MVTMFLAAILFGIMGFLAKVLTGYLPGEEVAFARFFIGLAIILLLRLFHLIKFGFKNKPLLILRGILGGIAIVLYFKSLSLIPLSAAVVITFSYPIFATLFAFWFLGEEIKISSIIAMLIAFVGVFFVANPNFSTISIGYLYALVGAIFAGGAVTSTRHLRKTDTSWSIALALMIGGTIVSAFTGIGKIFEPTLNIWLLIILMSIIATTGQLLLIYSYKFCNVLEGGTISMVTVPIAIFLAVLFLGENMTISFISGAGLIIGSTLFLLYSQQGEIRKPL